MRTVDAYCYAILKCNVLSCMTHVTEFLYTQCFVTPILTSYLLVESVELSNCN